jgi:DegV family protein with EDD domain
MTPQEAAELGVTVLPAPFIINGSSYQENVTLSRADFFHQLEVGADVSTSQPSLAELSAMWDQELEHCDELLYIPISSGLSGSCMSAAALASEEPYAGRVFVVDNGRVATPQYRSVLDALELVREGYDAKQIQQMLETARANMCIYVAVDTLEYLRRGGRISSAVAALGSALRIKPVLQFDVGTLSMYKKCRGMKAAKHTMIEAMRQDLEGRFSAFYKRGEAYLLAASSADEETTAAWVHEIEEAFPGIPVLSKGLSLAVSCHIGPNGLGIGCSCRPERI